MCDIYFECSIEAISMRIILKAHVPVWVGVSPVFGYLIKQSLAKAGEWEKLIKMLFSFAFGLRLRAAAIAKNFDLLSLQPKLILIAFIILAAA